ncbi:MAG: DUF2007 domain-containing protein [Planctomycetes bacterium]|nr:DUF2007 domain-containing protein [Planctomycetota bacterium]
MPDDPNQPTLLTAVPSEPQAVMIVASLEDEEIPAWIMGALTSGFRAATPGQVQVLVRQSDVERAREILQTLQAPPEPD